jgi:lipopolysaccharide biosynthesis regulator YciM
MSDAGWFMLVVMLLPVAAVSGWWAARRSTRITFAA